MQSLETKLPGAAAAALAGFLTISPVFQQTAQATEEHYREYHATSQKMDDLEDYVKRYPDGVAAIVLTQQEQESIYPAELAASKIEAYLKNEKNIQHVNITYAPDTAIVPDNRVVF